jgi:hypothetical protein
MAPTAFEPMRAVYNRPCGQHNFLPLSGSARRDGCTGGDDGPTRLTARTVGRLRLVHRSRRQQPARDERASSKRLPASLTLANLESTRGWAHHALSLGHAVVTNGSWRLWLTSNRSQIRGETVELLVKNSKSRFEATPRKRDTTLVKDGIHEVLG